MGRSILFPPLDILLLLLLLLLSVVLLLLFQLLSRSSSFSTWWPDPVLFLSLRPGYQVSGLLWCLSADGGSCGAVITPVSSGKSVFLDIFDNSCLDYFPASVSAFCLDLSMDCTNSRNIIFSRHVHINDRERAYPAQTANSSTGGMGE